MSVMLDLPSSPSTHPARRRWLGGPAYWACQAFGWGGVLAATVVPILLYPPDGDMERAILDAAILDRVMLCGFGLSGSHLLRIVWLVYLRRRRSLFAFARLALPWIMVVTALQNFWMQYFTKLRVLAVPDLPDRYVTGWTIYGFVEDFSFHFTLAVIWTSFYLGVRSYRRHQQVRLDEARLLAAAREADLRALKAQLNPHFLFNSLNSLRALLPLDLERPREAITRLADLLRASLASGHEQVVPLDRELETVENYLALEHLRHEHRLRWRIEADAEARDRPVPPFLVQGLVENAVKHGIDRREAGGEIVVEARIEGGGLRVVVTGPGTLENPVASPESFRKPGAGEGRESTGVGLVNARARLALLFGPEARLALRADGFTRVVAEVFIPASAAPDARPAVEAKEDLVSP